MKSKIRNALVVIACTVLATAAAFLAFCVGLAIGILHVIFKALPYLLIAGFIIWMCTGCVYQPINIDVYVPTAVQVGGDVTLDTVGNKLSEVSK